VVPWGLGAALVAGLAGGVAYRFERAAAAAKRELVDGRGRLVRPLAAWLLGVPIAIGAVGLVALVFVGAMRTGSLTPAVLLLVAVVAVVAMARPLLGSRALTAAVEALENGQTKDARRRLESLDAALWPPESVRSMAAFNLGLLCLQEGRLDEAGAWYERAGADRGRGLPAAGLALVRALDDRYHEAEQLLGRASATAEGRTALGEMDAVRMIVALRRDGTKDATTLGERLSGPGAGTLFLALWAYARWKEGDEAGARDVLADPAVDEMFHSKLGQSIPELQELNAAVQMAPLR
jgi:tetratricopeptide (TPR) repeat protein